MPLIFKLVNNSYEFNIQHEGDINLESIHNFFITNGINKEYLDQTTFIINSELISDPTKIYSINLNEIYIILVNNQQNSQEMQQLIISMEKQKMNEEIFQPITQNDEIKVSPEIINKLNEETLLLFTDPDFINILSIYKRKPELFNILSNYIQSTSIVESLVVDNDNDLSSEELNYYSNLTLKILNLNLGVSKDLIMNKLIKYSGHLNLTIRAIINEIS